MRDLGRFFDEQLGDRSRRSPLRNTERESHRRICYLQKRIRNREADPCSDGPGKATAIREIIQRTPDAVFGNSVHDAAMLELAHHPFAINPNPDLLELARDHKWTIYQPLT